jgi:octaprenyl-diphosphate synthase
MDLKELIAKEATIINQVMHEDIERLTSGFDPLLAEIIDHGLFGGGKRVRPLLTVLSARLSGRDDQDIYRLACAFEYLHVASLFHDDVIDRAESRRGKVSVNKRYGSIAAILAGDFLLAHSMAIVGDYAGSQGLKIFTEATRGMVDGEFVQLRNGNNFNQSEDDYFTVVMGKTALLIGAACEVGAIFGGADPKKQSALRTYGINLGCAFQIVDDLLDYLGDQEVTGKAVGNDLKEGKMTLPLIIALKNAPADDKNRLLTILKQQRASATSFPEVVSIIKKYEGFTSARTKAEVIVGQALEPLQLFNGEEHEKSISLLQGLSAYVLKRDK